jgi:hypothetical protein
LKKARSRRNGPGLRRSKRERRTEPFEAIDRLTVAGLVIGDICFACECRVFEIAGGGGVTLAWCECGWPEDHHEMEVV